MDASAESGVSGIDAQTVGKNELSEDLQQGRKAWEYVDRENARAQKSLRRRISKLKADVDRLYKPRYAFLAGSDSRPYEWQTSHKWLFFYTMVLTGVFFGVSWFSILVVPFMITDLASCGRPEIITPVTLASLWAMYVLANISLSAVAQVRMIMTWRAIFQATRARIAAHNRNSVEMGPVGRDSSSGVGRRASPVPTSRLDTGASEEASHTRANPPLTTLCAHHEGSSERYEDSSGELRRAVTQVFERESEAPSRSPAAGGTPCNSRTSEAAPPRQYQYSPSPTPPISRSRSRLPSPGSRRDRWVR